MQPSYFKSYLHNVNRVRMIELIDDYSAEMRLQAFRASLVVNPITGRGYDAPPDHHVSAHLG